MAWRGNINNEVPNPIQNDVNRSESMVSDNRALYVNRETDKFKNFTITIKDVDETVFTHLQKLDLTVTDAGKFVKVPVSYASPEKWKSVRNDGFMRDNNGKIILPSLIFYRTNSESDKEMLTFNKYLRYSVIQKYSQKNQYTKFSVLEGKNAPVHEIYNVVMPDHMSFTYKFIVWTEYIEQMNGIIERINFETNDYWGSERGFRFRTSVDSYSHITDVQSAEDRMIKTEFDLTVRGYLLPERYSPGLDGFKPTTEKTFTPKKVIFGVETVQSNWKPRESKEQIDKWRSLHYPNMVAGTEPSNPPMSFKSDSMNEVNLAAVSGSN